MLILTTQCKYEKMKKHYIQRMHLFIYEYIPLNKLFFTFTYPETYLIFCTYIYIYIYVCVCVCLYIYIYIYISVSVCIPLCIFVSVY